MKNHKTLYTLFTIILLSLISISVYAQSAFSVKQIDINKLPKGIKYEGKVKSSARWTDAQGDNIVLLTETGIHVSKKVEHEYQSVDAEIFAYHYIFINDSTVRTWNVYDYIFACPVDIEASFINNTFQITDLDSNGIAEVWLMYKKVCHGDVSPSDMKIIMYEGKQKFALRGQNKVYIGEDEKGQKQYDGGEYTVDKAFADGPKAFLQFAKQLWQQNIMQTWGE